MFSRFNTTIKIAAISALILAVSLTASWAIEIHNASIVIQKGGTSDRLMTIAESEEGSVNYRIPTGAVDDYLDEQGKDRVKITVEMIRDDVNGVLLFTFGPSGAHFDPPCKLKLRGDYIYDDYLLVDENGELLEYTVAPKKDLLVFEILHFSEYYYDGYDY